MAGMGSVPAPVEMICWMVARAERRRGWTEGLGFGRRGLMTMKVFVRGVQMVEVESPLSLRDIRLGGLVVVRLVLVLAPLWVLRGEVSWAFD